MDYVQLSSAQNILAFRKSMILKLQQTVAGSL